MSLVTTTPRVDPCALVAGLKPGAALAMDPITATRLLNERLESPASAKGRFARVTFAAVSAACGGHWGWYVAAARRHSGNTSRRGFRMLVAGPFRTKTAATKHAAELRFWPRCLDHEDCCAPGNFELARECWQAMRTSESNTNTQPKDVG